MTINDLLQVLDYVSDLFAIWELLKFAWKMREKFLKHRGGKAKNC